MNARVRLVYMFDQKVVSGRTSTVSAPIGVLAPEVKRTSQGEAIVNVERFGQFGIGQTIARKLPRSGLAIGGDWLLGVIVEERSTSYLVPDDNALPVVNVEQVLDWEWSSSERKVRESAQASMLAGKIVWLEGAQ